MVKTDIIRAFGLEPASFDVSKFGSGHINNTFLLSGRNGEKYILQKINTYVFREPGVIARNQRVAVDFLDENHPS